MSVFNSNIRFLRKKLRLSQQKFADDLGEKRGKIAAYEESADARPEFYKKLIDLYQINLHRFLIDKMTEETFDSFFIKNESGVFREPVGEYFNKSEVINKIQELKKEDNTEKRGILSDEVISMVVRLIEENGNLHRELLESIKVSSKEKGAN